MANIEVLAPELLLSILSRICHLHDLHNLLAVSPACSRTFDAHSVTIVEAVLSGQQSILSPHMQQLVRTLVLIRAGTFPLQDLEGVKARCIGVSIILKDTTSNRFAPGPGSIPPDTPPAVLRGVVATSAQIHALTHDCLRVYLGRLNAITPQHCHEKYFAYEPTPYHEWAERHPEVFDVQPWDREFAGTPYTPVDAGPPSWVEHMRVKRTFWRICIFFDLQTAGGRGLLPSWSTEDLRRLGETRLLVAAALMDQGRDRFTGEFEQIQSVMAYVRETSGDYCEQRRRLPRPPPPPPGRDIAVDWSVPVPGYDWHFGGSGYYFAEWPPSLKARRESGTIRYLRHTEATSLGQSHSCLRAAAPGWMFYLKFSRAQWSPLLHCKFDPYRRLGMAFWDTGRLALMELLRGSRGFQGSRLPAIEFYTPPHWLGDDFFIFTWRSLLSADELAEVKNTIRTIRGETSEN